MRDFETHVYGCRTSKNSKEQTPKAEFESMSMKDGEHIENFCMKVNGIVTNIRVLGETMKETYVVKKLLRAMPTKFLQIASTIKQFGDMDMTVVEVVGRLKAHEERIRGQTDTAGAQLLLTQEEWSKRSNRGGGAFNGGQKGWNSGGNY